MNVAYWIAPSPLIFVEEEGLASSFPHRGKGADPVNMNLSIKLRETEKRKNNSCKEMYMKTFFQNVLAKLSILALTATSLFAFAPVHAAMVTSASNTLTRHKISETTDMTIDFTIGSPIEGASSDTLILTFSTNVDISSVVIGDVDINDDAADTTLAADCSGSEDMSWVKASQVMTFTACTNDITDFAGGSVVSIEIGTVASGGSNGVVNHSSAETSSVAISGNFGDTGSIVWPVIDDDQVTVTATVAATMTFDLDDGTTDSDNAAPYTVDFGTVGTDDIETSGATDSINGIYIDLDTNATGGAVVAVLSLNGALDSASVPADTIPSASATMANGTANYGFCVAAETATTGAITIVSPFDDGTCATDGNTNDVGAVTTSWQDVLNTGGDPIAGGRASLWFSAGASATTAAHDDYGDTLTFRATATF